MESLRRSFTRAKCNDKAPSDPSGYLFSCFPRRRLYETASPKVVGILNSSPGMSSTAFRSATRDWIVPPEGEHRHTFILLHGRGDTAFVFGNGLIRQHLPGGQTLRDIYRDAKFIFLQAPLRELAAHPGTKFFQWFDVYDLKPGSEESDLQIPDLRATIRLVHGTLREEINLVGAENVVLGGLSQGCASSLISTLLWDGPPFAACIGMSGWLPFRQKLESAIAADVKETAGPNSSTISTHGSISALAKVLDAESYPVPLVYQKIPFFLGHGKEDAVVVSKLGREAASCITTLNARVNWLEYEELDHWYSSEMLHDVVGFLQTETGWNAS